MTYTYLYTYVGILPNFYKNLKVARKHKRKIENLKPLQMIYLIDKPRKIGHYSFFEKNRNCPKFSKL
jgi:hypothetical protein